METQSASSIELSKNSAVTRPRVGRPWPKGFSGNSGGRPKGVAALRSKLNGSAQQIIKALLAALNDSDGRVRLEAIKIAFAYLYGKPSEQPAPPLVEEPAPPSDPDDELTPEQAAALLEVS
jgi:hypothetical protein